MNSIRVKGLAQAIIGIGVIALVFIFANSVFGEGNWKIIGWGMGVPGALALVGLIQLVSGVPFSELSSSWDSLKGWQRGILGSILFIVSCGIIFGGIALYLVSTS